MNNNVKETRLMMGLSQEQLAAASDVSRVTIQNIENGGEPKLSTAFSIARALGVSVYYLWDNNPTPAYDKVDIGFIAGEGMELVDPLTGRALGRSEEE